MTLSCLNCKDTGVITTTAMELGFPVTKTSVCDCVEVQGLKLKEMKEEWWQKEMQKDLEAEDRYHKEQFRQGYDE